MKRTGYIYTDDIDANLTDLGEDIYATPEEAIKRIYLRANYKFYRITVEEIEVPPNA